VHLCDFTDKLWLINDYKRCRLPITPRRRIKTRLYNFCQIFPFYRLIPELAPIAVPFGDRFK
jgi:hypothetical protein